MRARVLGRNNNLAGVGVAFAATTTMAVAGRSISMFSLITDGILEPGEELLTFDYLVS